MDGNGFWPEFPLTLISGHGRLRQYEALDPRSVLSISLIPFEDDKTQYFMRLPRLERPVH